jgi:hypothetical protein
VFEEHGEIRLLYVPQQDASCQRAACASGHVILSAGPWAW